MKIECQPNLHFLATGRFCRAFLGVFLGLWGASAVSAEPCTRIVSLAPSITEVVFDLDLGSHLVGVTSFCDYPPEARDVPRIGGFLDVNLERVVTSKPDIVFALSEHEEIARALEKIGLYVITVDHRTVAGIKESLRLVGKACGRDALATRRLQTLAQREQKLRAASEGQPEYRVLVAVGRTREGSSVTGVYVSGSDGFYSDLLVLLGMRNVNRASTVSLPTISVEGLLALAPEAVVEIADVEDRQRASELASFWKGLRGFPPAMNGKVVVLTEPFASIPGPRYIELAERISQELRDTSNSHSTPNLERKEGRAR